jgi:hypothetical protein
MKKSFLLLLLITLGITSQSVFATPPPPHVPDSGTTSALLAVAVGGLFWARRFLRR